MVTDLDGRITQNVVYIPYGEVFVEERNGNWASPYLFNAKELDEETGLYYYGARYLNPSIALWLSTDPLQGKYPGMSPYNYCAGNPVKLVDPDGMDTYYNSSGDEIGCSASGTDKYIVTNKEDLKTLKQHRKLKQYTEQSSLSEKPFKLPSAAVLEEATDVLERTYGGDNKGFCEESSLVTKSGSVIKGQRGERVTKDTEYARAKFPFYEDKDEIESSIHSHPPVYFTWEKNGAPQIRYFYGCDIPSKYDADSFKDYNCNIIVGKKGLKPDFDGTGTFIDKRPLGFSFYGRNIVEKQAPAFFIPCDAMYKILKKKMPKFPQDLEVNANKN